MGARITCVVSLYFSLLAWQCQAQNLRVAVASNFRPALEQLAPIFFAQSQIVLTLSSGASGQLVAQIQQGAPFDVFLSADTHYPQYLHSQGLANMPVSYAQGRLLLIGREPANSWQQLLSTAKQVGLANPELVPYGAAAKGVLTQQALWPAPKSKVYALASNVSQVQQWFETGQLDAAFVAASLARTDYPAKFDLTTKLNTPIEQHAVILKRSRAPEQAKQLLQFLQQAEVQQLLATLGYQPITEADQSCC